MRKGGPETSPRFLIRRGLECIPACKRQPPAESLAFSERSRLEQMVCDLARTLDGTGIEPLDRIGDNGMQVLSARGRDAGKQRLTHQFMGEGERLLGSLGARDNYSHLLRLLDGGEKFVNVDLTDLSQQLKAETASDHRSGCQCPLFILVEAFQTAANDQAHVFRNVDLVDLDVSAEPAGRIKDFPILDQMPVHLLDEEWIPLAFFKDEAHQTLR